MSLMIVSLSCYVDLLDLHVLTPPFPTRRPSDLKLHGLDPRLDLAGQIDHRRIDDRIDDRAEFFGLAVGHAAGRALVLAALTHDHIGGDGPGRSEEHTSELQ